MPLRAIQDFLRWEAAGGILLMTSAGAALVIANVPGWAGIYATALETPVKLVFGAIKIEKNVLLFINDGLMTLFFLLVALEIKREFVDGEFSRPRQVLLPAFAALGGLACPAVIYSAINWGDPIAVRGWAIPAATDIAFSLGVLSLFGARAPLGLKVFLTAVAVLDDLAAIVIIALFYTAELAPGWLVWAGGWITLLILFNRLGGRSIGVYCLVGSVLWVCMLKSGVHATLAGVVLGLTIPAGRGGSKEDPLHRLEHALHPWIAFGVLPLFALANAGVELRNVPLDAVLGSIPAGIALGLVAGKTVGVFTFAGLAIRLGWATLPERVTWGALLAVAALAGIGFTMSLFIGGLAFPSEAIAARDSVRVGVLGGSLVAACLGYLLLHATLPRNSTNRRPAGG